MEHARDVLLNKLILMIKYLVKRQSVQAILESQVMEFVKIVPDIRQWTRINKIVLPQIVLIMNSLTKLVNVWNVMTINMQVKIVLNVKNLFALKLFQKRLYVLIVTHMRYLIQINRDVQDQYAIQEKR